MNTPSNLMQIVRELEIIIGVLALLITASELHLAHEDRETAKHERTVAGAYRRATIYSVLSDRLDVARARDAEMNRAPTARAGQIHLFEQSRKLGIVLNGIDARKTYPGAFN